ncbi:lysine-N-methylase [Pseudobutyrivibrio sp. YE44]|uniref:flagellin lysine-N-methylase n=1 Tax=Pseudobutyrivibrio sp. YE44 TaxID=1520802 RepID=UPI000885836F|nr:flagellin lysine-N-methylase [Pseudobutyrivibrio sp. YE44]SDB40784.1 lysine-N-methylase [Pseudobutyrivibrio sp. YE44]
MIYRKQTGYDDFKCIADKCPKSCCIGWQIMIDDESLDRYSAEKSSFGDRLKGGINFDEKCFRQNNTRCSMLNDNGLCDLHSTLGEDKLCYTCKMFPRHVEEFQDIREYSLSLSCPEVTRMILEPDYEFDVDESEDETFDDPDEFEEFDLLLFDRLDYARDKMLQLAAAKELSLQDRMSLIAGMGLKLQRLYDNGAIFDMDDVDFDDEFDCAGTSALLSLEHCTNTMDVLLGMEVLEESWRESIKYAQDFWKNHTLDFVAWKSAMYPEADVEFKFQKILECLLFTYFCGAAYDGQIYARTMIAVQSTRWLMMLHGADKDASLQQIIYLYSREVEHSDINVNRLIEFFEGEL